MLIDKEMLKNPKCQACGKFTAPLVAIHTRFVCFECALKYKKIEGKTQDAIFEKIKNDN